MVIISGVPIFRIFTVVFVAFSEYSRPSMARTLMASLTRLFQTHS